MDGNDNFEAITTSLRRDVISMAEKSGHVACALSCLDMLAAAYFGPLRLSAAERENLGRDRFILSKGHAAMALYAVLARAGYFEPELLASYYGGTCCLAGHPIPDALPGVELGTGSLGHGLAFGVGLAQGLAARGLASRVFVLLGDGECDEGSVWEAAAMARSLGCDNLTALVDWNGQQACGSCGDISKGLSLLEMWRSFGWDVEILDGHDGAVLMAAYARPCASNRPRVLLCRTVKGRGVDFMEGDLEWHYRPVRGDDRARALRRLGDA